jgi:hypothetical protein
MPKDADTEPEAEAKPDAELAVSVTQGVPEIRVRVAPNNTVSHEGEAYAEGDELTLDGPTAIAWMQAGHVELA